MEEISRRSCQKRSQKTRKSMYIFEFADVFIFFNSSMHTYFVQIIMTSYVIITHMWQCVPLLFLTNCRTYSTYKSLINFDLTYSFLSTGSWTVLLPWVESWKLFLFAQRGSHLQYSDKLYQGLLLCICPYALFLCL